MSGGEWSAAGSGAALIGMLGVLMLGSWVTAHRAPSVLERIGPHLGRPRAHSSPVASLLGVLVPRSRSHRSPPDAGLASRLSRAAYAASPAQYRLEQVAWGAVGAVAGAAAAAVLAAGRPAGVIVLGAVGALTGVLARQWQLTRTARQRRERIEQQLPAVAELLAFAVSAGEPPFAALVRAASTTSGELSREVAVVVADMRAGDSLEASLRAMAGRICSSDVDRFVDALTLAVERGTPLAEVLRAQAGDARAHSRRMLMELAGRKDVLMLVPVVFLVLPTVVAVALLPGLTGLNLISP